MRYHILDILKGIRVKQYDRLTDNREFYEAAAIDRRADPVYIDVVSGVYTRYFACRSNFVWVGPVYEIDQNQYSILVNNPNFIVISFQWRIRGKLQDDSIWINGKETINPGVISQNKALIEEAALTIPAIKAYFYKMDGTLRNPTEYYLGEFPAVE